MPPSYSRVEAAVARRIAGSAYTLTLYYGVVRPTPSEIAPAMLPVAPLVGVPNPVRPMEAVEPERADAVSMPCLYTELTQMSDGRRARLQASVGNWAHDTRGLARVQASAVRRPQGGLYLEGVRYAEVNGVRYKVLGWTQTGGSGSSDGSFYVQLGQGIS